MKYPTLATILGVLLLLADLAQAAEEHVCNFSVVLKPGQIEKCESLSSAELTTSCLNDLIGKDGDVRSLVEI